MGINASDFSGLANSTTYYFKLDGYEYSITTGTSPTYQDVCTLVNAAITADGYSAFLVGAAGHQDIRVANLADRGYGGTATLSNGVTSPNLFGSLLLCPPIRPSVIYPYSRGSDAIILNAVVTGTATISGAAITSEEDAP